MNNLNTLLENSDFKHNAMKFDQVKVEDFIPALKKAVSLAKDRVESIKNNTAPASYKNTIETLEQCSPELDQVLRTYYHLLGSHTNEPLQAIAQEISKTTTELSNSINLDEDLFKKVDAVYKNKDSIKDSEELMLLENTYLGFARNGVNLNADDKEAFKKISTELSSLGPQFSKNVLEYTNSFELLITDKKDTDGIPDGTLAMAQKMAKDKNKEGWLFNLQAPSYVPFMKYSKNREQKKEIYLASSKKAFDGKTSNQEIVKKIVNLRLQKAKLLGYKNHAEFVLEKQMAEKPEKVYELINKLYTPSFAGAKKDVEEVKQLALEMDNITDFQSWDFSYYSEKLKAKKLNFDEEEVRPYFEANASIQGAFDIASILYQLEFKKADYPVWQKDVTVYEVFNKKDNSFIGLFYVDLYPRDSKRAGAWCMGFKSQGLLGKTIERPHAIIVCNFSPSTDDTPSLLNLREVTTLFHEFGHALHQLLSNVKYKSLSGTNVYRDFVELPSQIMENWVFEKECLDMFAKHYKTGESIPQHLIDAIIKANQFQAGYASLRQLSFGMLDMAWHTIEEEFTGNVAEFEEKAMAEYKVLPTLPDTCMSTAFSHLFNGGYSAGYYGYKWAEILDADAFEYFKENGIFNTEISTKFKTEILEKGGTAHPMQLYKNFRGREPQPEALLKREGFI